VCHNKHHSVILRITPWQRICLVGWILAVTFVVYLFSFQTGYPIVNPGVQRDAGLSDPPLADIG